MGLEPLFWAVMPPSRVANVAQGRVQIGGADAEQRDAQAVLLQLVPS